MAYDARISEGNARITLSGDVDLQTTSELKAEIASMIEANTLEIDASAVLYIDSSGVAVLLFARQHCVQHDISFSIPLVSVAVSRLLETAKLDCILPIGQVARSGASRAMEQGESPELPTPGALDTGIASGVSGVYVPRYTKQPFKQPFRAPF